MLSSLPIYQASFLLAPKSITGQLNKLLRDFLWHGGRGNQRKLHLVKWDTVKRPLSDGGLQIRDPGHVNTALRFKILWHMFNDPNHLACRSLRFEYLHGASLRHLKNVTNKRGTQLWDLCRRSIPFFLKYLYQIPGSGKCVKL